MALTLAQKNAMAWDLLIIYKNGLPPGDPEIPTMTEHIQYRVDLDNHGKAERSAAKNGPGSTPIGPQPPPPTS